MPSIKKSKILVTLKSGRVMTIICEGFKLTHVGNEITRYEISGMTNPKQLFLRIEEIAAVEWLDV